MRSAFKTGLYAAALTCALGAAAGADEPLKIRLSYIVPVSNWATILFQKPELAHHLGKSYTFEPVHFDGTPQLIQALAVNELEIANLGFTTVALAVVNAGMSDLRIIADELQDGVPGYYSNQYLVLNDSPIKTVDDLKGKILAINQFGSGTDVPMRAMLTRHNLLDKRDVSVVEAPIPAMLAMLGDHKVDLIAQPLPFTAAPKLRSMTRTLFTQGEAMGITQLALWAARAPFIAAHRAQLVDFMEDALRAERWYADPANHKEAVEICVKVTKLPADHWDSWLFRKDGQNGDYYRDPNGHVDVPAMQAAVDATQKLGFLKKSIAVKDYTDFSLVDDASQRLK